MAELTLPRMDWSPLGQLGNVYKQSQNEQGLKDAFAGGIGNDAQSLAALAQRVGPYNPQLAVNLAQLSHGYTRQGTQDARQASLDQFNQRMETERLSLSRRAADRADDPTPAGFVKDDGGGVKPLPGGPADPNYIARKSSITAIPEGFQRDDVSGGLKPIPGGPNDPNYLRTKGDRQNAPSGYQWIDPQNPSAGMTPIAGGPAEKVDAEVAGRLGLAKSFLGQLNDHTDAEGRPQIGLRARVKAGEATGLIDGAMAAANVGEPGSLHRKISSGAEALLRMLTGAGMSIPEAQKYVKRYEPQWNDSSNTLLDKINQLDRELNSVGETVGKGRGGWNPTTQAAKPETAKQDDKGFRAPPKMGELRGGYRFKGGNPGDPANWAKAQDVAAPSFGSRFDASFNSGNGS